MNNVCHVHNGVTLRAGTTTTLYELWKGRKPNVKYFHVLGSKCYILADRDYRRKMDPKSDEGIFWGTSLTAEPIEYTILEPKLLWNLSMW